MKKRVAKLKRTTRETDVMVEINLDGCGKSRITTGLPFLDHMLVLFAKHSSIDMVIVAKGDLEVDAHHTVEDIGLTLGEVLNKALGDRKGITRYGWSYVPMDDALARAVIDLGGRPYLVCDFAHRGKKIEKFDLGLIPEFLRALSVQGRMNLHVAQLYGVDAHHAYESVFKAMAKALSMACSKDARVKGVPSSKGTL
ncbi:MAG: imidazoleglycerol-phosphate dehydratase HisB [bacterium]